MSARPATAAASPGRPPSLRPLRVAFVLPGLGIYERGAEIFVRDLSRALAARHGFEIDWFCRGAGAPAAGVRAVHPVPALARDARWASALYGATWLGRKGLDTLFLDPLNLEWDTAALASAPGLWRGGYDAVVMEGGFAGAWVCRLLRFAHGTPWIDIAHGNSPKWERAFARQGPDRVVAFTAAAAAMIQAGAPRARIAVVPHGVDLDRFRPGVAPVALELRRPVVLLAGSVDPHKRMHLTVEALARLGRGSLVVLGDGESAAELDRLALARLGESRYLRRRVPRDEIAAWYTAADVFTLPSITESFGLVYLEALASGRPVVGTDDAVRREVIGDAGLCCDVENPEAYAGALERALSGDWGDRPRRQAERFSFTHTADAYAELLRDVVRERARAGARSASRSVRDRRGARR